MKKLRDDKIEIMCSHCQAENSLSLEDSMEDIEVLCIDCGSKFYWHNCPKCDTGYSDLNVEMNCPECLAANKSIDSNNKISLPLFEKRCPWCDKPVNMVSYILFRKNIGSCPSCKKYFEDKGTIRSIGYFLLFSVISAVIFKSVFVRFSYPFFKFITFIFVVIGGLTVLIKAMKLEKYK